MKIVERIDEASIARHLVQRKSACGTEGCRPIRECHLAFLEEIDLNRVYLWREATQHSDGKSNKLADMPKRLLEDHPRVKSFWAGDPANGYEPIDSTMPGMEPTLVTDDIQNGPLYAIDGNHRLMAHFLSMSSIDGVRVYVCECEYQIAYYGWAESKSHFTTSKSK